MAGFEGLTRQSELVCLLLKSIDLLRTANKEKKPEGIARSAGLRDEFVKLLIHRVPGESGGFMRPVDRIACMSDPLLPPRNRGGRTEWSRRAYLPLEPQS